MANTKITSLTELADNPASGDMFAIVDVSDTSMADTGTTKKISATRFFPSSGGTISGNLTVSGNLVVSGNTGGWAGLPLNTGGNWANVGSGQQIAEYKISGDMIYLRGFIYRTSGVATTIATMPVGARPPAIIQLYIGANDGLARISVDTLGVITLNLGSSDSLNLTGVVYSTMY